MAARREGWESYTQVSKELGRKKMKGATWSVCTHRAPGDPEFATSWNHPMLLFLGQYRMEPVALCLLANTVTISPPPQVASGASGGITDVWELPGHSCSIPCASWRGSRGHPTQAPHSSTPPAHPTWASCPVCTLWLCSWGAVPSRHPLLQVPQPWIMAEPKAGCPAPALVWGKVAHSGAVLSKPSTEVLAQELWVHSRIRLSLGAGKCPGGQCCGCLTTI